MRSSSFFKNYVNGSFGLTYIDAHLQNLREFPSLRIGGLSKDYFQVSLLTMGDLWKRFIHDLDRFPFKLFALLDCKSDEELLIAFQKVKGHMQVCPKCIDIEFTSQLLTYLGEDKDQLLTKLQNIQEFLLDAATFVPLSSDAVECIHGLHQRLAHRFRGQRPTAEAAQEEGLWSTIQSSYRKFWQLLWKKKGDPKARQRVVRYGRKGFNQYSQERVQTRDGSWGFNKLSAVAKAPDQKKYVKVPKRLCGLLSEL